MKILLILLTSLMTSLGAVSAVAQEDSEEGEVIVIAELNRAEVRQFIKEVQAEFYAVFNANNDDPKFNIECYEMTPTSSHIKQDVCEPKFMREARSRNANDHQVNNETLVNDKAIRAGQEQNYRELQERMEALTARNAQFRELASILTQLQARQAQLER